MTPGDLALFAQDLATDTRAFVIDYVSKAVNGMSDRLSTVIDQRLSGVRDGKDGKDADESIIRSLRDEVKELRLELGSALKAQADMAALVASCVADAVKQIPLPKDGVNGMDGSSVTADDLTPMVSAEVAKAIASLPPARDGERGKDGQSVTVDDVAQLIAAEVAKAVSAMPAAVDGASVAVDDVAPLIVAEVQKAVAALPPPKDGAPGKSIDPDAVDALITATVQRAVASLPAPKDGTSITVEDVAPLVASEVQKAVSAIPVPKDGVGLTAALIDRDGHLVVTLSDGDVKDVGPVVGRDADMSTIGQLITEEVGKIPRPKDGVDGKDGFGFDDIQWESDGERAFTLAFVQGDRVKAFQSKTTIPIYRGVYVSERAYEAGDMVTFGGSMWIAKVATAQKPEEHGAGARDWTLCVKRGRDGKEGPQGLKGLDGRHGKDAGR